MCVVPYEVVFWRTLAESDVVGTVHRGGNDHTGLGAADRRRVDQGRVDAVGVWVG
jgi:hypothetical protein